MSVVAAALEALAVAFVILLVSTSDATVATGGGVTVDVAAVVAVVEKSAELDTE